MDIKFTSIFCDIPKAFYPKPAQLCLPDWYKESESYFNTDNSEAVISRKTIKKCMPVFDSITSGYIVFSAIDISVKNTENGVYFQWPNKYVLSGSKKNVDPLEFHDFKQVEKYPMLEKEEVPKFVNPWGIQTPKGYSVFVTSPMHRDIPFDILPAIVDTDKNHSPINFPFLLKNKWSGIIPCGTPIAQIIPFKRDSWKMSIGEKEEEKNALQQLFYLQSSYIGGYKKFNWNKKEFK